MAHDSITLHESWVFLCSRCLTVWDEDFEVQHSDDGHGGDVVLYRQQGQRCVSPWTDHVCGNCGGHGIKARPMPWTKHAQVPAPRPHADRDLIFHLRKLHAY